MIAQEPTSQLEIESELAPALARSGLFCLGWFVMADAPFEGRAAVLIGNRPENGIHAMWEAFSQSAEFTDGQPDRMNRWTERMIDPLARQANAVALYPFGEKLWPFQRWAKAATGMNASPLGILIHPAYGLWQAFRAVLVLERSVALAPIEKMIHPCDECIEKPCLTACPASAFSGDSFDAGACRRHLRSGSDPNCMTLGCRARAACPVGLAYCREQIQFHMQSFAGN